MFDDFSNVSDADWMERIIADLKGKIPTESLFTNTLEGVTLNPFYSAESTEKHLELDVKNDWLTTFEIDLTNPTQSNAYLGLKDAELSGFDALYVRYSDLTSLKELLDHLKGKIAKLHLDYVGENPINLEGLQLPAEFEVLTHGFDVISQLLKTGNMPERMSENIEQHLNTQETHKTNRLLLVNASLYKNAGAKIYQEIGCILAELQEYIDILKNNKSSTSASNITVKVACGTDYFLEIAKLRSLRLLIANLLKANGLDYKGIHLIAEVSNETVSREDPYTNILRLTTSNISAVIGGCDSLIASPFMLDEIEFATRIAKNVQLMLKHEAHLNKVANPANGSYFIEQLSVEISEKAWLYFKELEQSGGLIDNLTSGKIQKDITASAGEKLKAYQGNQKILIGVNKYKNPDAVKSSDTIAKKERGLIDALHPINYAQRLENEP